MKNMKKYFLDIVIWTLTLLWCGTIFGFSAENDDQSGGRSARVCRAVASVVVPDFDEKTPQDKQEIVENMQFAVRKTAHFTAYGILGCLICLGLRRLGKLKRLCLSLGLSALYAASDEFHQTFVPGRNGSPADVLLDSCGALVGAAIGILIVRLAAKVYSSISSREVPGK